MGNVPTGRRRSISTARKSYLVHGRAPASILGGRPEMQSGKRPRKTIAVTVTSRELSIQGSALPQLNCRPDAVDATSITIMFEEDEVDELKMTQFSETTCLITMVRGNDVYFIPLRDCSFDSRVKGRKFHHNSRKRVPRRATQLYYREPKVECPTCRTLHKMSEIVEGAEERERCMACGSVGGGGGGEDHGEESGTLTSPGKDCVVCLHAKPTMRFSKCGHLCTCKPCLSLYLESKNITLDGPTRKRFASGSGASGGAYALGLGERMDCAYEDQNYDEAEVARKNDTWMDFTDDILTATSPAPAVTAAATA